MSSSARRQKTTQELPAPTRPVNVIDGIPDRSPRPAAWKYVLLGAAFLGWLAFLIYCQLAGGL